MQNPYRFSMKMTEAGVCFFIPREKLGGSTYTALGCVGLFFSFVSLFFFIFPGVYVLTEQGSLLGLALIFVGVFIFGYPFFKVVKDKKERIPGATVVVKKFAIMVNGKDFEFKYIHSLAVSRLERVRGEDNFCVSMLYGTEDVTVASYLLEDTAVVLRDKLIDIINRQKSGEVFVIDPVLAELPGVDSDKTQGNAVNQQEVELRNNRKEQGVCVICGGCLKTTKEKLVGYCKSCATK